MADEEPDFELANHVFPVRLRKNVLWICRFVKALTNMQQEVLTGIAVKGELDSASSNPSKSSPKVDGSSGSDIEAVIAR